MTVDEFYENAIAVKMTLWGQYNDALIKTLASGVKEYTLDTGQGRQTVIKLGVNDLVKAMVRLENEISEMNLRINGGGVTFNRGQ